MSLPNRDRLVILAALFAAVALAWAYLASMPSVPPDMSMDMGATAAMPARRWDAGYFMATLAMWMAMMTGMMVPSAAPTVLLFGALQRQIRSVRFGVYGQTALFVAG